MELVRKFKLTNELGLHARAAAKIVALANQYDTQLFIKKDGREEVDGGSILSILTLSCPKGTEIEVRIAGDNCRDFLEKLQNLFDRKFGEDK